MNHRIHLIAERLWGMIALLALLYAGRHIYIIESGEVEVVRELVDDKEEVVAVMGQGEHFGEMGPLFGLRRSATIRATTPAVVKGYTTEQFRDLVGANNLADLIRAPVRDED